MGLLAKAISVRRFSDAGEDAVAAAREVQGAFAANAGRGSRDDDALLFGQGHRISVPSRKVFFKDVICR